MARGPEFDACTLHSASWFLDIVFFFHFLFTFSRLCKIFHEHYVVLIYTLYVLFYV